MRTYLPDARNLAELVKTMIGPRTSRMCQASEDSGQLTLWEFSPVDTDLADFMEHGIRDVQQGREAPSLALASISLRVARYYHRVLCLPSRRRRRSQPCPADAESTWDLLVSVARLYFGLLVTGDGVPASFVDAMRAEGLSEIEIVGSLDATIKPLLHASADDRELLRVVAAKPIVQVNTPISEVGAGEYVAMRRLAQTAAAEVAGHGQLQCEVTSDFVTPADRDDRTELDEELVRAAIYRSSAMITFTQYGRFGTAIAWTLAEELLMPVLVLSHESEPADAARFRSTLGGRSLERYSSAEEAATRVRHFLGQNMAAIAERSRRLARYQQVGMGDVTERFARIEVSAFDASPLSFEKARFFVSDPIHWFQGPAASISEIRRVLGIRTESPAGNPPVAPRGQGSPNMDTSSARALLVAAETNGLSWRRLSQMIAAYEESVVDRPLSARGGPWSFEDWVMLERRLPGPSA